MSAFKDVPTDRLLELHQLMRADQDTLAPDVPSSVGKHAGFGISYELSLQVEEELTDRGVQIH